MQVQTISAAAGEVVEGQQVRELPLNGENFMNLVTLSPGVSPAADFNGSRQGLDRRQRLLGERESLYQQLVPRGRRE